MQRVLFIRKKRYEFFAMLKFNYIRKKYFVKMSFKYTQNMENCLCWRWKAEKLAFRTMFSEQKFDRFIVIIRQIFAKFSNRGVPFFHQYIFYQSYEFSRYRVKSSVCRLVPSPLASIVPRLPDE